MSPITFFDLEIDSKTKSVLDIGAIRSDGNTFHKSNTSELLQFTEQSEYLCGHNIIAHDLIHLSKSNSSFNIKKKKVIDTLLFSPLLFPNRPYHRLIKDDKFQTDELNNPLNDAIKARDLFYDELNAFHDLKIGLKNIYYGLLHNQEGFADFFEYIEFTGSIDIDSLQNQINSLLLDKICKNNELSILIRDSPIALAYAISLIECNDRYSITPPWVLKNYPDVERIIFLLRNRPCIAGCQYCNASLNPISALKRYFKHPSFREYGGEPLQELAVKATINNKSILAIFPTGGGKSITFQVPALMSGENAKALTVIISPLQSLMKDQVDNLEENGITEAITINGLLDPIERAKAIERIENGNASLLYISPESLRSNTIERLLLKRKIARFVIDEAHCFSSWGQDFRVDYLYIGDFIKELQQKKNISEAIPVSCFTATAKQKVIEDILLYFKLKLGLELEIYKATTGRTNLHYRVYQKNNEEDKYNQLRNILESKDCPSIVYVSRTKRAYKLAQRLSADGQQAKPYHGKMDKEEKMGNQNSFMSGETRIMVATSAFGMGVDKSDVGMVIHYDISDSLENYVQEAGRAGRDQDIEAECYVLFNETDLDKHFILLNQTKITSKEINQVWKAVKDLTKTRDKVSNSALEIARKAGWDESINEIETRVTTAISALEESGYLKRGQNMPRIFANSILSKNAAEAIFKINASDRFDESQKIKAIRIIKKLFSSKSKSLSTEEQAESRVDYISDQLGIVKEAVIRIIELLREEQILADSKDLTAFIKRTESANRLSSHVEHFRKLEVLLLSLLKEENAVYNLKEINESAIKDELSNVNLNQIKTVFNFWSIKNWIKRQYSEYSKHHVEASLSISPSEFQKKLEQRHFLAKTIINYLLIKADQHNNSNAEEDILVDFSVMELKQVAEQEQGMFQLNLSLDDIEDTLFYLTRIEALKIEGGFLVVHNRLSINRLEKNNRIQYKESDYEKLALFYQQKVQQIHIVGEYAKKMITNYKEALQFVEDYFSLNYTSFLSKYFPGSRRDEINRTLTPEKFRQLFGDLSIEQLKIINDKSQFIVVAAGPGSGKTRVLVHKLASLILTEDIKHEQLLMLTFSRAAATEFKQRLHLLIGNAASYIEIKTFHSFCFDLLGRVGSLAQSINILTSAISKIRTGDIELSRITKSVLVIDEAQDMNPDEYELVKVLMDNNPDMRVILVGDDDQNIYSFRGSDSRFMSHFIQENNSAFYELTDNYRSKANIVDLANQWAFTISDRLKQQPGFAKDQKDGIIQIKEYKSANLLLPAANAIADTPLSGSTCVLTKSNEEAVQLTGLLIRKGLPAKLIQSNESFPLSHLYEIRYFTDFLSGSEASPIINEETWIKGVSALKAHAKSSNKLELALGLILNFEKTYNYRKYKSDWDAFIFESRIEDYLHVDKETIYVSTMHKAKGKEFDNVYIILKNLNPDKDEPKRLFYVAVTRAKSNLNIHYTNKFLKNIEANNLEYLIDSLEYDEPDELAVALSHRDVQLGYFSYVQRRIQNLFSGAPLSIQENGLANQKGELIIKYSASFRSMLLDRKEKGYAPQEATINFIAFWKDEKMESDVKVILPILVLKKKPLY